jgi:hypothetical protein
VKKTKTGVFDMEKVENVVKTENKNLETAEKVEKVERRTESKNADKKNMEMLSRLIMEKIETLGIDLTEIRELNEVAKEVVKLNIEIQKLCEKRLQLLNRGKELYEKIDSNTAKILEFLGLISMEEVERAIGKVQTAKTTIQRASNGNGVSHRRIVFQGKVYNIGAYFMRKMGINGGLQGLQDWATKNGYKVVVNENEIIIS